MEWMLSVGGLAIVAAVILTLDTRVRVYAGSVFATDGTRAHTTQALSQLARTAWDLCRDHQPLAVFVGIACLLVIFMKQMR